MKEEVQNVVEAHSIYNQGVQEEALKVLETQIAWYRQYIKTAQTIVCGLTEIIDRASVGPVGLERAFYWAQSIGCERQDDGGWNPKEGSNLAPGPTGYLPTPVPGDAKVEDDN